MGDAMEAFSAMIVTCRGPEIERTASKVKAKLRAARELDLPRPFLPLFQRLEQRLEAFGAGTLQDGIAAARWCSDHNLVQQGYTILEEVIFTHVVSQVGGDPRARSQREITSHAFTLVCRGWAEDRSKWGKDALEAIDFTLKVVYFIQDCEGLDKTVGRLRTRRNDINHAGFTDGPLPVARAGEFASELKGFVDEVERALLLAHSFAAHSAEP
jgi:hypothetical protein